MMKPIKAWNKLQLFIVILSMLAVTLLSFKCAILAFSTFLVVNFCSFVLFAMKDLKWMAFLQFYFIIFNIIGIYNFW